MDELKERFALWWEMHPGMWWFDLKGRVSAWIWTRQEKLRAKVGALRELDAFRALVTLEPQLAEWPRAIPLLEQAVALYDATHQIGKRDAILRRLEEVDPANATVQRYGDVAKKVAQAKVDALDDSDRRNLETARRLMRETGRLSTTMLQRRMGISYNHAARLVDVLRAENGE